MPLSEYKTPRFTKRLINKLHNVKFFSNFAWGRVNNEGEIELWVAATIAQDMGVEFKAIKGLNGYVVTPSNNDSVDIANRILAYTAKRLGFKNADDFLDSQRHNDGSYVMDAIKRVFPKKE